MDLLSNYDDEASNTSNNNETSQKQKAVMGDSLQSEWENFEKMIENSAPSSDKIPVPSSSVSNQPLASSLSAATKITIEDDEDDESHLPPGVRKKNRCHTSSSSESEDEEKDRKKSQSPSDSDSDDSDDSASSIKRKAKDNKISTESISRTVEDHDPHDSPPRSKIDAGDSLLKRAKHSRSASRSRSRSPHRKRRRSSERSRHSRSKSRDRHRRKEKKHRSHRSRSRDKKKRSHDRDHHRRRRDHKRDRSRSRDRDRRDKGKDRRGSHDKSRRSRSRSRDRRGNRSPSPRGAKVIKYGDKVIKAGASFGRPPSSKPMTFKEKMRQQLIKAMEEGGDPSSALTSKDGTVICTQTAGTQQQMPAPKKPPVPLMANLVTSTAGLSAATITASEAAMQSMLALQKETTEKTGVEIPKYYNPAAINPVKYAEQVQKRKLLWSKNKEKQEVNSQWHATTLSSEHDDKSKEKFRKLMGIKNESSSAEEGEGQDKTKEEQEIKQRELFEKLDKEYQFARMATHTHRGIGLGFGSSSYQPPPS